ncbi:MAG: hypothetical protein NT047_07470, partial [Deltaproteobacteria bacterium]|nr:hypothetical protein [Deltaproteobacteria bacterium]
YRRAILHEQAAPSSVAAVPNLADITQQYAAAQGRIAAQSQALKSDVDFSEKKLAEQGRQFTTKLTENDRQFAAKLDMDRKMLDTWGEQNKWATAIAIANLGLQGLAIPAQSKTREKQDAILQDFAASMKSNVDKIIATYGDRISAQEKINAAREAEAAARIAEINAPPVQADQIGELGGMPHLDLPEVSALRRRNSRGEY